MIRGPPRPTPSDALFPTRPSSVLVGRKRGKIGGAAPGRETAELRRLRQPGRAREDWHQIGQLGARAVRGEPIFGAQEIVERTALRVRKQRLGLCPALAADCGENLRVEMFFLARKNGGPRLRRKEGAGVSGIERARRPRDRQSVVWGKRVSLRGVLGGGR